jgi:hypothetical protein
MALSRCRGKGAYSFQNLTRQRDRSCWQGFGRRAPFLLSDTNVRISALRMTQSNDDLSKPNPRRFPTATLSAALRRTLSREEGKPGIPGRSQLRSPTKRRTVTDVRSLPAIADAKRGLGHATLGAAMTSVTI